MRQVTRTDLLWYGGGLLCYLAGMALACLLTVGVLLSGDPASALSTGYLLAMAASGGLLVFGRAVLWRVGDGTTTRAGIPGPPSRRPEPTTLERLGYRAPPETDEEDDEGATATGTDTGDGVVCAACGTRNERGFDYCRECSAELGA